MKRINKALGISAMMFMSLCIASCASEDCIGNRNSIPLAGFFSSQPVPEAIKLDSINIVGIDAPGDSLLLSSLSAQSEIALPFRLDSDKTSFEIRYMQKEFQSLGLHDIITFQYTAEPRFVSATCGAMYDFKINSIEHTTLLIDSVTCPERVINNQPVQNIRIYFRTEQPQNLMPR